ncbi:MAG: hypothetical protein IIB99_10245 [Planctomycetes bacterium]|nr:hypothetical protein [Planctomycetota bacterium]
MRRWRVPLLVLIVLPIYGWLLMVAGLVGYWLLLSLGEDFSPSDLEWDKVLNPLAWIEEGFFTNWEGIVSLALPALLVVGTQIIFLLPVFSKRLGVTGQGRSLKRTVCAAGLVGGFLFTGLILSLLELFKVWEPVGEWITNESRVWGGVWGGDMAAVFVVFWVSIAAGWLLWLPILFIFARRAGPRRFHERLVVVLLAGTVLETLVIVPIDVMVRRRTDCYCGTGTFFALCISIWAWLWLTGPGIVLAITAKRRRLLAETHCVNCGYGKGPSPGSACPECGYAWLEVSPASK